MSEENTGIEISMDEETKKKFESFKKKEDREAKLNKFLTEGENAAIYKQVYDDPTTGLKQKLESNPEIIDVQGWMTSVVKESVNTYVNKPTGNEAAKTTESAPPPVQQGGVTAPAGEQKPETVDLRTVGRKGGITVDEFCKKTGMTKLQASEYLAVLG